MSFVDLLRGTGIVVFIVVLAGVIAYLGDRVGHQVGRKRLTLFNIRPRYTSTIIAVGTGMLIALIVTLAAIFASNQVKTAFFRLNAIYTEIDKAQQLEQKITTAPVVVNVYSLMSPVVGRVPLNAPSGLRRDVVDDFYKQTVRFVNQQWTAPPYDLKKFVPPGDLQATLNKLVNSPKMQAAVTQTPVLLFAIADQNLYAGDPIHFEIKTYQDRLIASAGQAIAYLTIPGGKNVSADLALTELLETYVPRQMVHNGMPPFFAGNVVVQKTLPGPDRMRHMVTRPGDTYLMTAFAAENVYAHTFRFPVVVTLQKAPAR